MIKYHYAFDENKRVVGIDEIDHNHRHGHHYYCLNCGCERLLVIKYVHLSFDLFFR